jgi:hypothetical protein
MIKYILLIVFTYPLTDVIIDRFFNFFTQILKIKIAIKYSLMLKYIFINFFIVKMQLLWTYTRQPLNVRTAKAWEYLLGLQRSI